MCWFSPAAMHPHDQYHPFNTHTSHLRWWMLAMVCCGLIHSSGWHCRAFDCDFWDMGQAGSMLQELTFGDAVVQATTTLAQSTSCSGSYGRARALQHAAWTPWEQMLPRSGRRSSAWWAKARRPSPLAQLVGKAATRPPPSRSMAPT